MNATIKTIIDRRSIRKYKTTALDKETIEQLLKAAMYAPSARNLQPWHFIVITDRDLLSKLSKAHPYAQMLLEAPVAILVCADENIEQITGYWAQDCAASTQNVLLAAQSLGLGACWLGVYPREERMVAVRELFLLPQNIKPFSLIAVGYADESKDIPLRFLEDRIHQNSW